MSSDFASAQLSAQRARDRLTGALSRLHFLELLREEKTFADRNGLAFLLCLIDVDQLRNINDRAGQRAGDDVLIGVTNRLRDVLDTPPWSQFNYLHARYDGDGLMVLLRSCHVDHGRRFAEALRMRVANAPFGSQRDVTVSIGVAAYSVGEPVDEVLARTERTLYLAKQYGRDCVEVAVAPPAVRPQENVVYLDETRLRARRGADSF
jgi:diguanylate cyclase (GGDEF)-like protein